MGPQQHGDDDTGQFTRIGAPAPAPARRGRLRLGLTAWLVLVVVAAGAGATVRLLQRADDPPPPGTSNGSRERGSGQPHGDTDADGRDDLLLSTTREIRAYTSTGTAFVPSEHHAEAAEEVVRGDVDGDGSADLVTVVPARDSLDVVLRLSGEDAYAAPQRFRVEGIGREDRMVLGDVDGDGDDDLVGIGDVGIVVALADDRAFGDAEKWADTPDIGEQAFVLSGKFTDDARADLLLVDGDDEHVSLRLLPGEDGRFGGSELWREVPGWRIGLLKPTVGDFDGDGRTDLAELGEPLEGGADVMVLRSRGVDFGPPQQWLRDDTMAWQATRIVSGDYDGDGSSDVATLERQADGGLAVVVRRSTGEGFRGPVAWLTGDWPGEPRPVGVGTGILGIR